MDIQSINIQKIRKYIVADIDADCESALPGGQIYGRAMVSLKNTEKSHMIQIHGFSAYLILKSELSKAPDLSGNHQELIFEKKVDHVTQGKLTFDIKSSIPADVMSSLDLDGQDFGEYRNGLMIKGVITGSYLQRKSGSELKKIRMAKEAKEAKRIQLAEAAGQKIDPIAPNPSKSKTLENSPENEKKEEEGEGEKKIEVGSSQLKIQSPKPEKSVVNEMIQEINLDKPKVFKNGHVLNGSSRSNEVHNEVFFVLVVTEDIEMDNDTTGDKIYLTGPVMRSFQTQSGGCCCKSTINVTMQGRVLNTNIQTFSDEIKVHAMIDMGNKPGNLKAIQVLTSFGVTPISNPKPDRTVWRTLSQQVYYPSPQLDAQDFDISENQAFVEKEGETVGNAMKTSSFYVSNTTRRPNTRVEFNFPQPENNLPFELWTKVKIGKKNGMGTFYSHSKVFKTVYAVKIVPIIKGSEENSGNIKGRVGTHLTVPFSVKAQNPPSPQDCQVIQEMYQGADGCRNVPTQKLGKSKTMVAPQMMPNMGRGNNNKITPIMN